MTAGELIEILKNIDPNTTILVSWEDGGLTDAESVEFEYIGEYFQTVDKNDSGAIFSAIITGTDLSDN